MESISHEEVLMLLWLKSQLLLYVKKLILSAGQLVKLFLLLPGVWWTLEGSFTAMMLLALATKYQELVSQIFIWRTIHDVIYTIHIHK